MLRPVLQLVCTLCVQPTPAPNVPGLTPSLTLVLPGPGATPQRRVQPTTSATPFVGSLSTTIELAHARRLTLSATPSPARCAPLLELAF